MSWRRRFVALSVGLVATLSIIVVIGLWMARSEPEWWDEAEAESAIEEGASGGGDGSSEEHAQAKTLEHATLGRGGAEDRVAIEAERRQAAEGLRNSVINQLHLAREAAADLKPGEAWRSAEWRVSLKAADVNAWLEYELPKWLANLDRPDGGPEGGASGGARWPEEVEAVRIAFEPGLVLIGARVRHGKDEDAGTSVISASLEPELRGNGSLWMPARWVRVGRLPAPAGWVVPRVRGALEQAGVGKDAELVLRVLEGEGALTESAVIRLEDGRRVRLLDLEARAGELWVTARTEAGK